MPKFGLSKAFGVGRGRKVFLNLQAGLTRGAVPDPWHRKRGERDGEIERLRRRIGEQEESLLRLREELGETNRLAEDFQDGPSALEAGALPDFAIIGAARCGTSRFYSILTKHPLVKRASSKELHFFDTARYQDEGLEWYRRCFPPPERREGLRTITGEATPMYLYDPRVPERMARVVPGVKLIALLRNPVDRTYSHYHKAVRNGGETRSFEQTVEDEMAEIAAEGPSGHPRNRLARSIYVDQVARWREFYDEDRMLILKSEDFFKDTPGVLAQTQDFLGLPRRELKPPARKTSRSTSYEYEPISPALRRRLEDFFEPHNRRLYGYLGRDFGW